MPRAKMANASRPRRHDSFAAFSSSQITGNYPPVLTWVPFAIAKSISRTVARLELPPLEGKSEKGGRFSFLRELYFRPEKCSAGGVFSCWGVSSGQHEVIGPQHDPATLARDACILPWEPSWNEVQESIALLEDVATGGQHPRGSNLEHMMARGSSIRSFPPDARP